MSPIRLWDKASADRVDRFVANSDFVAARIRKYYGKDSTVIHPPVDTDRFFVAKPEARKDYFLMVGRLIAYKRFDIAIEAFNRLKLPLRIIGRGPEERRLRKIAGPTIEFLGRVSDEDLPKQYAECRAFVFPQEEDFGIVAIEAMASGRPVIAFRGGDIEERIEEGISGVFFDEQTPEAIIEAVRRFENYSFSPENIREKALPFDKAVFTRKIEEYVSNALSEHLKITKF
jgi:glycosyltransferase involved in cell wall biosynthesis